MFITAGANINAVNDVNYSFLLRSYLGIMRIIAGGEKCFDAFV
jgi:hypothetical protein